MKKQVENKNIKKKYPKIRFKEFSETWEQCKLKNLLELHKPWAILDDAKKVGKYKLYGVNGLIGYVNYGEIKSDFISIVKDGSVGKINFVEKNSAVTTTMHCFTAKKSDIHFVYLLLKNFDFSNYIVGSIIAHIHFSNYGNAKVNLPKHEEQNLISNLFKYFGNLITLHQKKLDLLKKFKKTLLEKMFSLNEESFPKIRFNGFFDAWEQCKVIDLLNFIRPDKYIVQNEKYIKGALTPVLTANKSFIIGHTKEKKTFKKNCIIFDDFTLNNKYVNFPFMVKSSAIKILIETENNNLFFIYLLLKNKNFKPSGHMRHYVNFVQNISLKKIKKQRRTR